MSGQAASPERAGVGDATEIDQLRDQIAWAGRILAREGYADLTLGHVSARVPGTEHFLIKRKGLAIDEVEPDDVVEVDFAGALRNGADVDLHLEMVIHAEIYRARPDVGSVVHGHPAHATALAATDATLEILTHDAVLFADGIGRYDESSDLITEPEEGAAVARALGHRRAVLLRNHGVVVVGKDVPWAVLAAATLERAVQIQAIARSLGNLRPITAEVARTLAPVKYRDAFVQEYWESWVRRTPWDT
jgi:L-ribulose-5-phosphate 4-epimerase